MAYENSQARGQIGAIAAGLHSVTAMQDLSCVFNLHHSSWQLGFPKPLREAREQTRILMDTNRICFCCAIEGNYFFLFFLALPCSMQNFLSQG